jgi:hypothetical protein
MNNTRASLQPSILQVQQEGNAAAEDVDPQTQKQLQLLRENYHNTAAFVADLLGDRFLQKQARLICHVLRPLHKEYALDLKAHGDGQTHVLYWYGDRCCGSYYTGMVVETFGLLKDTSIISLFNLRPQPTLPEELLDASNPLIKEDVKIVNQYYRFIVELTANRCWSQSFWSLLFPYCIAGLYATDMNDRRRCSNLCRRLAGSLLKLEDMIGQRPRSAELRGLRDNVGTADWPLVRDVLRQGCQCEWNPENEDLRLLVFTLFGGPGSTKGALESCFNWLKDSAKASKSKKMNQFTKFFYTISNPYVRHAGVEQIRPDSLDFKKLLEEGFHGFQQELALSQGLFNYKKTPLGATFPRPNELISNAKIRKAGFHSNRNAAAACAFMLHNAPADFAHIAQCWPGGMDLKKGKYVASKNLDGIIFCHQDSPRNQSKESEFIVQKRTNSSYSNPGTC